MTTNRKKQFKLSSADPTQLVALRHALTRRDDAIAGRTPWTEPGDAEFWSGMVEFWINRLTD